MMDSDFSFDSLHSESKKLSKNSSSEPEHAMPDLLLNSKTPEKPADLPGLRSDPIRSARRQILSWHSDSWTIEAGNAIGEESSERREQFDMFGEFFDALDTAIRLLKMKRSMPTFTNIRPKIEVLTKRRFSYDLLAQMKYLFPEAIEIKRVLKLDSRTSCMVPDIHVALNLDVVEYDENLESQSKNMALRKMFRARLEDFAKAYPEFDEVPKETLPEPFNNLKQDLSCAVAEEPSNGPLKFQQEELSASYPEPNEIHEDMQSGQPAVASHLSRPSRRPFIIFPSEKIISASALSQTKLSPKLVSDEKCVSYESSPAKLVSSCPPITPIKDSFPKEMPSTPAEHASTPARFMSVTPAQRPPKRSYTSPDDSSISSPNKIVRCPSRSTRSLKFDFAEETGNAQDDEINEKDKDEVSLTKAASSDADILDTYSESLLLSAKEEKALEDQDPEISQTENRRDMISRLPKLFDAILFTFRSIRSSVITKQELVHKIIAADCNIVDQREVEEKLSLMLELVPEWISEKMASSGDLLVCINKKPATESIRARLGEASKQAVAALS